MSEAVRWAAEVDEVITGDITVAVAYITPAGGAVVTAVAPCGISRPERGELGFTTSLGFSKKLERIVANPRVALAYHARDHGFSASPLFVLAQGSARVDLQPSLDRLIALAPQVTRYLGAPKTGPVWDRLLREYYQERVIVEVAVERIAAWPDLSASGEPAITGAAWPPGPPAPQQPPKNGTGPRVDVGKTAGQIATLPHRLLAYRGADGFPVVVPVQLAGHDAAGLRLAVAPGLLPDGGRRAGLLAHSYRPQLVGLSTRALTGWLEVSGGEAVYAPHTSRGFRAPPRKNLLLVSNGLLAKYGMWQARRQGTAARLAALAGDNGAVVSRGPRQGSATDAAH
jgi:hypothetical protein